MVTTASGTRRPASPAEAVARCLAEAGLAPEAAPRGQERPPQEREPRPPAVASHGPAVLAAMGTTARHALDGPLLSDALAAEGVTRARALPFEDPAALLADPSWRLALVLSPWKQAVATRVDRLTPSAARTGVVDTVVRGVDGGLLGVNTNSWAAQAAMETLLGGAEPAGGVLVLGAGGSTGSVALAVRRAWPRTRLVGSARNPSALAAWAAAYEADAVEPDGLPAAFAAGSAPDLIVNTTTWGETDASEEQPFAFPLSQLLVPGGRFFDLNNRTSGLQHAALAAGMSVMSGTLMQRVTHRCRAALLTVRVP